MSSDQSNISQGKRRGNESEIYVIGRVRRAVCSSIHPSALHGKNLNVGQYSQLFGLFVYHTCHAYKAFINFCHFHGMLPVVDPSVMK